MPSAMASSRLSRRPSRTYDNQVASLTADRDFASDWSNSTASGGGRGRLACSRIVSAVPKSRALCRTSADSARSMASTSIRLIVRSMSFTARASCADLANLLVRLIELAGAKSSRGEVDPVTGLRPRVSELAIQRDRPAEQVDGSDW